MVWFSPAKKRPVSLITLMDSTGRCGAESILTRCVSAICMDPVRPCRQTLDRWVAKVS